MSPLVWANQVTVVAKTKLITAVYLTLVNVLLFRALSAHVVWVFFFFFFFFNTIVSTCLIKLWLLIAICAS